MMDSKHKLLLIIPKFFGYEKKIIDKLSCWGWNVDVVYENIEEINLLYRFLIRFFPTRRNDIFAKYYLKKIPSREYNKIFVIRGSSLTESIILNLKRESPNSKLYMYQWDSVKNNKNALLISNFFDDVFTFDYKDAEQLKWKYRPLFYVNESKRNEKRNTDITFICSLHSQRIKLFNYIKTLKKDKQIYAYLYSKRSHYIKQKYIVRNPDFLGLKDFEVRFKPLSLEQVNKQLSVSDIVLDYTHPDQTGFTMRTIESMGHRCKLVTNNSMVKAADFYNPNNVYVYKMDSFNIPVSFFENKYTEVPESIYKKYSLDEWLKEILDL